MFNSLLYLIDLFGRPVTISFFGKEKYKSNFGGACSIIFFCFLAWALYNASKDLFDRTNPTTIFSQTYLDDPGELIISPQTFPLGIGIQGPSSMNYYPYINESIYTVDFVYTITKTTGTVGNLHQTYAEIVLAKEICTPSHFGELADNFATMELNATYCIAKNQPEVGQVRVNGVYVGSVYETIVVRVTECQNSTSNPIVCATPDVMKKFLMGGWFNVLHVGMAINPNNYSRPDAKYRDVYTTMIGPTNYKETYFDLGYVDVKTDSGWIVSDIEVRKYADVIDTLESLQFEPNSDGILISCFFEMSRLQNHYSRTYKKIQDVLAQVGGLANVGLAIMIIVITPYLNLKFRESLINELFDIYPLPQKCKQNKKENKKKKGNSVSQKQQEKELQKSDKEKYIMHKVNTAKNGDIQIDLPKSNHTYDDYLQTKSPLMSPTTHPDAKQNMIAAWENIKSEKKYDSPLFGSSPRNSPKKKRDNQITLVKNKTIQEISKQGPLAQFMNVRNNSLNNLDNSISSSENSEKKEIENQEKKYITNKAVELESPVRKGDISAGSPMTNQQKLTMLTQKVVTEENEDKYDDPEYPSMILEDLFSDRPLEVNAGVIKQLTSQPEMFKEEKEEEQQEPDKKDFVTIQTTMNHKKYINESNIDTNPTQAAKSINNTSPQKINLTIWEYISSFFCKSESLKQKMDILSEGIDKIDTRLDVINIMKKLREIDKLKAMLLEHDQLILFDNLPKPEIRPKSLRNFSHPAPFSHHGLLRKSTFIEQNHAPSLVLDAHVKLEEKAKKNKIDTRLISIFKEGSP